MIVDAALGHSRERRMDDRQRFRVTRGSECAQTKLELGGMRKLRRAAKAAVYAIEAALEFRQRDAWRATG